MVNTHHRIRMLREERGLTISALAEKTGISRGAISRYENRGSPRDLATWRKLADFFQVPVLYLMGYTKPRRNGIIISLTGIPNEDAGLITETLVDTAKEELPEMAENTQIGLPRWMCKYWDILIGATGDIQSMLDRVERIRFYTAFRTMADVARMDISKHEIPLCYLRCRDFSYEGWALTCSGTVITCLWTMGSSRLSIIDGTVGSSQPFFILARCEIVNRNHMKYYLSVNISTLALTVLICRTII